MYCVHDVGIELTKLSQHFDQDEDAPQVVDDEAQLQMESGAYAGLQTAEQVTAQLERRKEKERLDREDVADFLSN